MANSLKQAKVPRPSAGVFNRETENLQAFSIDNCSLWFTLFSFVSMQHSTRLRQQVGPEKETTLQLILQDKLTKETHLTVVQASYIFTKEKLKKQRYNIFFCDV